MPRWRWSCGQATTSSAVSWLALGLAPAPAPLPRPSHAARAPMRMRSVCLHGPHSCNAVHSSLISSVWAAPGCVCGQSAEILHELPPPCAAYRPRGPRGLPALHPPAAALAGIRAAAAAGAPAPPPARSRFVPLPGPGLSGPALHCPRTRARGAASCWRVLCACGPPLCDGQPAAPPLPLAPLPRSPRPARCGPGTRPPICWWVGAAAAGAVVKVPPQQGSSSAVRSGAGGRLVCLSARQLQPRHAPVLTRPPCPAPLQLTHADLFSPGTRVSITNRLGSCARRCGEGSPPPGWVERVRLPWPPVVETNLYDVSWKYNMR